MRVREIMSHPALVVRQDATLEQAARLMLDKDIGSLPVVDGQGRLVGIVTESDFAAKEHGVPFSTLRYPQLFGEWMSNEQVEKVYHAACQKKVAEIMTRDVATVTQDDSIEKVLELMLRRNITRIPVIREGIPVGIIARRDLLKLMASTVGK
jgi:CBS domain-containing protein